MRHGGAIVLLVLATAFAGASAPGGCAAGAVFQGGDVGGGGGGTASGTGGSGASSTSTGSGATTGTGGASAGGAGGTGPCILGTDCVALTDACNVGTCINGACEALPANDLASCDDGQPCTDAACHLGVCEGAPKACPGSDECHVGGCDMATELCTDTPIVQCASGDGCCAPGCTQATDDDCVPPTSFQVLATADITYQGIDYLVLKVSLLSDISVAQNWCYEYQNLCKGYGFVPTGCGQMYTSMNNGYGTCKTTYGSDGISDSLGCNPSGGVAAAAQQAGFNDATTENSFGFHYCDANTCSNVMCSGQYCNTALSYFDKSKPHGFTLCKK